MTRRLINYIALLGSFALMLLVIPAICHAAEWEQKDRDGNVWSVSIPKHLDPDILAKQRQGVDVNIEAIVYRKSATSFWLVGTETTDWELISQWADGLEKLPGIIWEE